MTTTIVVAIAVAYVAFKFGQEDILNRFRKFCEKRKQDEDVCSMFDKFDNF
jgi:hypothetical protein